MTIDEFNAADKALSDIRHNLAIAIMNHENNKPLGMTCQILNNAQKSWVDIRVQLNNQYIKVNQQRMDLASTFSKECLIRLSILD